MELITPYRPDHPIFDFPRGDDAVAFFEQYGEEGWNDLIRARNERIRLSEQDPLHYGCDLPPWKDARALLETHDELLIQGGNRAGKSEFCAKTAVDTLVNGPFWMEPRKKLEAVRRGVLVACFHASAGSSIKQQQASIYKYLPPNLRDIGKQGRVQNVSYTVKNGFSENSFVLPGGAQCIFFNYFQDVGVLQGYEFDFVWMDELAPQRIIDEVRYRLATRSGKLVLSFTPIDGYSVEVKNFVAGADVVASRPVDRRIFADGRVAEALAPGCPKGELPYILQPPRRNQAVIYFHSDMNPFSPFEEILSIVEGARLDVKLMRAYGYTDKVATTAFPLYGKAHRITRAQFEALAKNGGTRYCCADPGGAKNWFIKWYFCTPQGHTIVYREFPDFKTHGAWAEPGKGVDWKPGPAQRVGVGGGISRVKRTVLEAEGWVWNAAEKRWDDTHAERIERRLIDPRMGGMVVPGGDESTSIIALMAEPTLDDDGHELLPSMDWEPAVAGGAQGGKTPVQVSIAMLNERLDYNTEAPLSPMNCPKWYIVDDLLQSDTAYKEFTGEGTDRDALKDVIDPDRYFVNTELRHYDEAEFIPRGGGSY